MNTFDDGDHLHAWLEGMIGQGYVFHANEVRRAVEARDDITVVAAIQHAVYEDPHFWPHPLALYCLILLALSGGDYDAVATDIKTDSAFESIADDLRSLAAICYNLTTVYRVRSRLLACDK